MNHFETFADERLNEICCYCGSLSNTKDHVPSKVLLNDPFPTNLPKVDCCYSCNQGFSQDEEYFACLIECIKNGTADIAKLKRDKIIRILSKKPYLQKRLSQAIIENESGRYFKIENERIENVFIKLAKGHIYFETKSLLFLKPKSIVYKLIHDMDDKEQERFFSPTELEVISEIGSRQFFQVALNTSNEPYSFWIPIQDNVYRYMVITGFSSISVRILVQNFLAAEIIWDNH